uniref:hypothetical protein n=1 Tax=Anabaena sp. (strain CA / ATCC 33047) TaxID=52271 RepID=UPI000B1D8DBE
VSQTTKHTFDALTGANQTGFKDGWGLASPFLGRVPKWSNSRSWLKNVIRPEALPANYGRDEYPYNTTIPGGPIFYELHTVSVRPVPKYEKQGPMLESFYTKANVERNDPEKMWFIVGTTKGTASFYIDRDGVLKTDLNRG